MASSGNFSTFNPLDDTENNGVGGCDFALGNCQGGGAGDNVGIASTIATGNTGKYYAEFYLSATPGTAYVGYYPSDESAIMTKVWVPSGNRTWINSNLASYAQNGTLYKDGNTSTSSWGSTYTTGDIIQIAIDADNDAVYYGKNNTWQNSGNPESGASKTGAARTSIPKNVFPAVGHANGSGTVTWKANFGQDSTFGGTISAGGNADANGFGDFKYAPPSGYVALSSANLPISDDIDPAQTDDDYPGKQFNVVTYTGNGSTINVTGAGFQPDFVWIKGRSVGYDNMLFDTNRGTNKILKSNSSAAEITTVSTALTSFDSDGFTYGSEASGNQSSATYVAWCWRANGGTTTTDTSGDISTVRQSNTASGFAILTWSGNGSNNQRLPHGLGKKPGLVIAKRRDASQSWGVWTQHLGANSKELQLNSSSGWQASSNAWYESGMTTDFVGIGSDRNISSSTNVAYVWTEIEGYSKFGLFEGNSNADGPFVYTGFRPRLVFCKAIDASENWQVRDTARSTFNANSQVRIYWNATSAESSASTASPIDFLSNGFKVRGSNSEINTNTIIYGAWADVPFKYNNTF